MQEIKGEPLRRRFSVYQRERFPLLTHGILVAVISGAGVTFSATARAMVSPSPFPLPLAPFFVAFLCAFGFFFQLRVADEFKDYSDDLAHRPYRPVPRGLIHLRELGALAIATMGVQVILVLWFHPPLAWPLLTVWAYMALMRYEFFAHDWLKARPLLYMLSHMGILPLIFLFITACEWLAAKAAPPGVGWFLAVGFFNGIVFEIGRKIRAPQDEEQGVETYSHLWGRQSAVIAWLLAMTCAAICAGFAAQRVHFTPVVTLLAIVLLGSASWLAWRFLQSSSTRRATWIETFSAIWTVVLSLGLGVAPTFFIDF